MKLQDYRETFYTFSGKASNLSRQLAFAAIALIWLFKNGEPGSPSIPPELLMPGFLVVAALALDMTHYVVAALTWRLFYRSKEKAGVGENIEIEHSDLLELPILVLFVGKIACVTIAYVQIAIFLLRALKIIDG